MAWHWLGQDGGMISRLSVLVVLATGCGFTKFNSPPTRDLDPHQVVWAALVGNPIDAAFARWGIPSGKIDTPSGGHVYQWEYDGAQHSTGIGSAFGNASGSQFGNSYSASGSATAFGGGTSWQDHCQKWVTTNAQEVITSADFRGQCHG
jgi:hypothetical protein